MLHHDHDAKGYYRAKYSCLEGNGGTGHEGLVSVTQIHAHEYKCRPLSTQNRDTMADVPPDLKRNADAIARLLKMRVTEVPNAGHEAAIKSFLEHLSTLDLINDVGWFNGEYLNRKITVALIKQALQHIRVPLGGATSKADLGNLLGKNLNKTQPNEDETDKDIALSVLNRWFMAPIKGDATKGLREGLDNEAEVLRLLKEYFVGADQPDGEDRLRIVKILHVGLLESHTYERVGTSVDAIVLLQVVKHNGLVYDTLEYEMACVEIKTKTSAKTIGEQESKLLAKEVLNYKVVNVNTRIEAALEFQNYVDVPDHRCQTLHHAATLGVRKTIYVVAAWKRILRVAVLDFEEEVRVTHMKVMRGIWSEYLWMYEDPTMMPETFKNANLGYIGTFEDLQFAVALSNGMRALIKQEGCIRTAKDIVPLSIACWNHLKGGVDVTSRYLKDCQAEMEGYCSPTQRIFLKIIKMYLLNAYRLYCATMTFEDLADGHITSWKQLRKQMNRTSSFQDFVKEASEVLGDFMLPGGESVWKNMPVQDAEAKKWYSSESENGEDGPEKPKKKITKRDRKVTKCRHRQDWVTNEEKQRCRLSKVWRKMGADQDDGHLHPHKKDILKSSTFRCVLCCRICFDPYGSVYDRDSYHNKALIENADEPECSKRDLGRVGNNASVKCTVCNVFLCDNKARFPNCEKTCWDIWHSVVDFEKVAKTLCHLKNPSNHGWVTVPKKISNALQKGGKRGASQSAVKPPKLRAPKSRRR